MKGAQDGFRFKQYVNVGMAAKYGSMGPFEHDTGIFYQGGSSVYTLVAMTNGVNQVDDLLATLNLRVNEWLFEF